MAEQIRKENQRHISEGEATRLLNEAIDRQNKLEWASKIVLEAEVEE